MIVLYFSKDKNGWRRFAVQDGFIISRANLSFEIVEDEVLATKERFWFLPNTTVILPLGQTVIFEDVEFHVVEDEVEAQAFLLKARAQKRRASGTRKKI
jgi:hypothetical protein